MLLMGVTVIARSCTGCFSCLIHNYSLKRKPLMTYFSQMAPGPVSNLWYFYPVAWNAVARKW